MTKKQLNENSDDLRETVAPTLPPGLKTRADAAGAYRLDRAHSVVAGRADVGVA